MTAFSQTTRASAPSVVPVPPKRRPMRTVRKTATAITASWAAAPRSGLWMTAAETTSSASGLSRSAR